MPWNRRALGVVAATTGLVLVSCASPPRTARRSATRPVPPPERATTDVVVAAPAPRSSAAEVVWREPETASRARTTGPVASRPRSADDVPPPDVGVDETPAMESPHAEQLNVLHFLQPPTFRRGAMPRVNVIVVDRVGGIVGFPEYPDEDAERVSMSVRYAEPPSSDLDADRWYRIQPIRRFMTCGFRIRLDDGSASKANQRLVIARDLGVSHLVPDGAGRQAIVWTGLVTDTPKSFELRFDVHDEQGVELLSYGPVRVTPRPAEEIDLEALEWLKREDLLRWPAYGSARSQSLGPFAPRFREFLKAFGASALAPAVRAFFARGISGSSSSAESLHHLREVAEQFPETAVGVHAGLRLAAIAFGEDDHEAVRTYLRRIDAVWPGPAEMRPTAFLWRALEKR